MKAFFCLEYISTRWATHGEECPDIYGFLEYVRTNRGSGGFASELAASVDRVKPDGKENEIYMSLATWICRCTLRRKRGHSLQKASIKESIKATAKNGQSYSLTCSTPAKPLNKSLFPPTFRRRMFIPFSHVSPGNSRQTDKYS